MSLSDHLQSSLLKLAGAFLRRFSVRRVQKMAAWVGRFAYRHVRIRRLVALTNLRLCFPEKHSGELENILEGAYVNIATVLFEFLYFPNLTADNLRNLVDFSPGSRALMESGFRKGNGLVMMSGHFSNWELIALAIGAAFPGKIQIVVHPFHNKAVDTLANRYRSHLGNSTVPMSNSIRAALTQLKSNGIVALLADQSAAKESAPAKFFGIEVPTFQGPASFALRTRADMLAGFLVRRKDGTYEVDLRRIDFTDLKDDSEENVKELTQRHVALLEDFIRRYPADWLWFHKRFKHTPEFQKAMEADRK